MVLSDRDIKKAIKEGDIVFMPKILTEQIEPASIDLKLGSIFKVFIIHKKPCVDLRERIDFNKLVDTQILKDGEGFVLHPNHLVLASTKEYIKLSNRIAARAEGKSSLARVGLLVHTAGFVDPGFEGTLTLEISNQSEIPIILYANMYICQIALELLSSPCEYSYSERKKSLYQKSKGPAVSNTANLFKKRT